MQFVQIVRLYEYLHRLISELYTRKCGGTVFCKYYNGYIYYVGASRTGDLQFHQILYKSTLIY